LLWAGFEGLLRKIRILKKMDLGLEEMAGVLIERWRRRGLVEGRRGFGYQMGVLIGGVIVCIGV